jgi:hypothetical protein
LMGGAARSQDHAVAARYSFPSNKKAPRNPIFTGPALLQVRTKALETFVSGRTRSQDDLWN